jgi:hypothetical protein
MKILAALIVISELLALSIAHAEEPAFDLQIITCSTHGELQDPNECTIQHLAVDVGFKVKVSGITCSVTQSNDKPTMLSCKVGGFTAYSIGDEKQQSLVLDKGKTRTVLILHTLE